jgi:hypothetical protein
MSRVPLYLQPSSTEASDRYSVVSDEWSEVPGNSVVLGQIRVSDSGHLCTFIPSTVWEAEGFFPKQACPLTLGDVEALLKELLATHQTPFTLTASFRRCVLSSPGQKAILPKAHALAG